MAACPESFANSTSEAYAYVDADAAVPDYQEGSTVTGRLFQAF